MPGKVWDEINYPFRSSRNGTQQDLNEMVDMIKLRGGGQKDRPYAENGGQTAAHTYLLSKRV